MPTNLRISKSYKLILDGGRVIVARRGVAVRSYSSVFAAYKAFERAGSCALIDALGILAFSQELNA
jgi:hypothetical protein